MFLFLEKQPDMMMGCCHPSWHPSCHHAGVAAVVIV
jgi:hypothetical protein